VEALMERLRSLGVPVHTATEATGLARRAGGWRVTTDAGSHDAEVVAVALPADRAAALLGTATGAEATSRPGALRPITAHLGSFRPTAVTLVTLLVEAPGIGAGEAPVGSGVLVAPDVTRVRAKAMTHASAKWAHVAASLPPENHLLRLSYGGRGQPDDPAHLADDVLVDAALADAGRLLGQAPGTLTRRASLVTRWHHGLVRPLVGRRAALDAIDRALTEVPDLALLGGAVAGNGLLGVVTRSRTEAARTLD